MEHFSKILMKHKLNIFIGAYGSGKSEISVNSALLLKKENPNINVLLADLDIVNPYYRSADAVAKLTDCGIRVVSSSYANSNVDVPALPGEMYAAFDDDSNHSIFDIGGEDLGANVLGSLNSRLRNIDYGLYMVVNCRRPFTSTPEQISQMTEELSLAAKIPITGYINNTNILDETTLADVLEGQEILQEASKLTGIPVITNSIMKSLFDRSENCGFSEDKVFMLKQTISYDY